MGLGLDRLLRRREGANDALQAALIESRARYKALVELSSDFAWETGPDGTFMFVSPGGALGYDSGDLVGRHPDAFAAALRDPAEISPFATRETVNDAVTWWRRKDGAEACLIVSAAPIESPDDAWRGARGVCRDATDEMARDDALAAARRREGLLAHILHVMRDVAVPVEMLAAAAAASARTLGARSCVIHAIGADGAIVEAAAFGAPDDPADGLALAQATRAAGRICATDGPKSRRIAGPTFYRQSQNGVVAFARDVADASWSEEDRALVADIADRIALALAQTAAHEALAALSRTDPLTGLLNRRAFLDDLAVRLARRGQGAAPSALVYVDLDNFKAVNDSGGHELGDAALMTIAELLVAHTRPGDLVARLGGDEFALWLERIDEATLTDRAAELVGAAAALAGFSPAGMAPLGFSIGAVAWHGGPDADPQALLARADAAMYGVKRSGKGGYAIVDAMDKPRIPPVARRSAAR